MSKHESSGSWTGDEVVSTYTRRQALEDGVLMNVSELSAEAGFKVPVAVTAALWAFLTPTADDGRQGQSVTGRLWDVLMILRANVRDSDTVVFDVFIALSGTLKKVRLKAMIGPGDQLEPVVTIMLPYED
jgi:hypothetical protein